MSKCHARKTLVPEEHVALGLFGGDASSCDGNSTPALSNCDRASESQKKLMKSVTVGLTFYERLYNYPFSSQLQSIDPIK